MAGRRAGPHDNKAAWTPARVAALVPLVSEFPKTIVISVRDMATMWFLSPGRQGRGISLALTSREALFELYVLGDQGK